MNPRFQRIATDWKSYVGLVSAAGAALVAFSQFFETLQKHLALVRSLPPQAKWLAAGLLALLGAFALYAAWSRRSRLLQPEKFIVSADDPNLLVGREQEVKELADACEHHPLVFLLGDSGAGKSALVLAGLLPHLEREVPRRFIALRIDASSLSWNGGLAAELARPIKQLSPPLLAALGAQPFASGNVFQWLAGLPRDAACQVLLVLDQIDDYAVAHRPRLFSGLTVIAHEDLEKANADWAALAGVLRDGVVRLLFICRSDAAGVLDAMRFDRAKNFMLPRMDRQLISPLLDKVTASADGKQPVVEDPECGWLQLRERLLRDLAAGGSQILPVQLAIALDSLRRFRFLTPQEYARQGGARGLERLHVERHVQDAARATGLDAVTLLRSLMLMVTDDGLKTRGVLLAAFGSALGLPPADGARLETLVSHLERARILRRQAGEDGESLLLYHDYLARGVREAYRHANLWVELLRERSHDLQEALGWRQCWQALLPLPAQGRLLWARLRGQFHYREHRRLAVWSTLRLVPWGLLLGAFLAGTVWQHRLSQQQLAEQIISGISADEQLTLAEAEEWCRLAAAPKAVRFHAFQYALSRPSLAAKTEARAALLVHAVVGLDPTGQLSQEALQQVVLPALCRAADREVADAALACAMELRIGPAEAAQLAAALVERMKGEQDSFALASLGDALGSLSAKLDAKDVQPGAAALVERMKGEQDSFALASLGDALGSLSAKLDAKDVQPGAAALVGRMKGEQNSGALAGLGDALGSLSTKLDAKDAQPGAAALVERMKGEKYSGALAGLGSALGSLSAKLDAKDVQPLAAALVERMKGEKDSFALADLGGALERLSAKLDAKDVQPLAAALVERMKGEQNSEALASLGDALGSLSAKLDAKDVQPGAAALVERMKGEQDSDALARLGSALGSLRPKLDATNWAQAFVDLLSLPLAAASTDPYEGRTARAGLLAGLQEMTGEKFEGDQWLFVAWATTSERGKALHLKLDGARGR